MRRAATLLVFASATLAVASDLRVEIHPGQRATIVGRSSSLRATLEDLCGRVGATLRYDGADQSVSAAIENEPLEAALGRLLRDKSYYLTMRHDGDGASQLAALHVLGAEGDAPRTEAPPPATAPQPARVTVTEPVPEPAGEPDIHQLVQAISSDPVRLSAFLEGDPVSLAAMLRGVPEAPQLLQKLRDSTSAESDIRAKLDALLAALEDPAR